MKLTPSQHFKNLTYSELQKAEKLFNDYPWENKTAYVAFLSNMYLIVAQACRLLTSAASRCGLDYDQFHHRFVKHAHEEKNHEKLITNDLRLMNEPLAGQNISSNPVWQNQFYLIEHKGPMALFGYILYFENLSLYESIGPKVYEQCLKMYGDKAVSYLRVHVKEDPDHVEKLFQILDQLPDKDLPTVEESLQITSVLFRNFLSALTDIYSLQKKDAA